MALKRETNRGLVRGLLSGIVLSSPMLWAGSAFCDELQLAIGGLLGEQVDAEEGLDPLLVHAGFRLPMAEEDVAKQVNAFNSAVDEENWGQAFRILTDLTGDRLDAMVPIGEDGLHMAVRVQILNRLLAMPGSGRTAFQLYFDGQANEMMARIDQHPRPGSDEQLALTRKLVDRMLTSSIGGQAADLMGDLYYERGQFAQAARSWRLALRHGSVTGQNELALQAKIVLALHRSGDSANAAALYGVLKARYGDAKLTVGGESVDVLAMLGRELGQVQQDARLPGDVQQQPLNLPKPGTLPAWHLTFLNQAVRTKYIERGSTDRYWYAGPQDLKFVVPQVVADDQQVYFHWLGNVYALHRDTGKINWTTGSISETAKSMQDWMQSSVADLCNYQLAMAQDVVLVTSTTLEHESSQFSLTAYDKRSGAKVWNSKFHQDWSLLEDKRAQNDTCVVGQVLVAGDVAYAIVHREAGADYHLRRFNPQTGEVHWSLRLGDADPSTLEHSDVRRMPQPKMLLNDGLMYVLMNNGSLVAVDVSGVEIAWARRLMSPLNVGLVSYNGGKFSVRMYETLANPNGAGELLLHDRTLYAKEHLSRQLVALNPLTGELQWSADSLEPDARLIGVDAERFYLMNAGLQGYQLAGEHDQDWNNTNDTGVGIKHAGAIVAGDRILALTGNPNEASGRLRQFDTKTGDVAGSFELGPYFDQRGGRLYRFDDLLICISQSQITAIKLDAEQARP